jgi:hypothetical protein
MKKLMEKTDSPYVKRHGDPREDWELCIIEP